MACRRAAIVTLSLSRRTPPPYCHQVSIAEVATKLDRRAAHRTLHKLANEDEEGGRRSRAPVGALVRPPQLPPPAPAGPSGIDSVGRPRPAVTRSAFTTINLYAVEGAEGEEGSPPPAANTAVGVAPSVDPGPVHAVAVAGAAVGQAPPAPSLASAGRVAVVAPAPPPLVSDAFASAPAQWPSVGSPPHVPQELSPAARRVKVLRRRAAAAAAAARANAHQPSDVATPVDVLLGSLKSHAGFTFRGVSTREARRPTSPSSPRSLSASRSRRPRSASGSNHRSVLESVASLAVAVVDPVGELVWHGDVPAFTPVVRANGRVRRASSLSSDTDTVPAADWRQPAHRRQHRQKRAQQGKQGQQHPPPPHLQSGTGSQADASSVSRWRSGASISNASTATGDFELPVSRSRSTSPPGGVSAQLGAASSDSGVVSHGRRRRSGVEQVCDDTARGGIVRCCKQWSCCRDVSVGCHVRVLTTRSWWVPSCRSGLAHCCRRAAHTATARRRRRVCTSRCLPRALTVAPIVARGRPGLPPRRRPCTTPSHQPRCRWLTPSWTTCPTFAFQVTPAPPATAARRKPVQVARGCSGSKWVVVLLLRGALLWCCVSCGVIPDFLVGTPSCVKHLSIMQCVGGLLG